MMKKRQRIIRLLRALCLLLIHRLFFVTSLARLRLIDADICHFFCIHAEDSGITARIVVGRINAHMAKKTVKAFRCLQLVLIAVGSSLPAFSIACLIHITPSLP